MHMSDPGPRKVPFQNLTSGQWWRLALAAMLTTYILIFLFTMQLMGMFNYLGLDFRTFLASAQIAAEEGFSKVYDLEVQQKYQLPIYDAYRGTYENTPPYETVPTPYIPVFIVPFLIFLPFSPDTGFLLYTFVSLAAFLVSTRRLTREFGLGNEANWAVPGILASSALFYNFFYGQVGILLFVALAEFLIARKKQRQVMAGMWLALWLIKPQLLILILPWLLVKKDYQVLYGFISATVLVALASALLAGKDWLYSWLELLLLYPGGLATTNPQAMINWRSIALNLEPYLGSSTSWTLAGLGMAATLLMAMRTWKRNQTDDQLWLSLTCTYAATCLITWHAHIHIAAPLFVPLLLLHAGTKRLSLKTWGALVAVPFSGVIASILSQIWLTYNNLPSLFLFGTLLYLVCWSSSMFIQAQKRIETPQQMDH
jgi:hypothetical protein